MQGKQIPDASDNPRKAVLIGYIEDFFVALNFPQAFAWNAQSAQWKQAQKLLSMTWEIGRLQLTKTAADDGANRR